MTVRVYRSSEFGAPVLSGQAGALIGVLDACLVTGFGSLSITSLTQEGGLATAVTASPHLYANSPKVVISNAVQPGYNGEVTATITGSNTFTFPVAAETPSPATGTITTARAGAGFSKEFSDTNLAVYRQPLAGANGFYFRVDDTAALTARVVGYEVMTAISAGTNAFPTEAQAAGGLYTSKSVTANTVARPWLLVSNGALFYLVVNFDGAADWGSAGATVFGDVASYKGGDAYGTLLVAATGTAASSNLFYILGSNALAATAPGHYMARSHSQTGGSIVVGKSSDYSKSAAGTAFGRSGSVYPSPVDGALYSSEVWVNEPATSALRGVLPGIQNPLHFKPLQLFDIWAPGGDLAGKTFEVVNFYNNSQCFLETSDTW